MPSAGFGVANDSGGYAFKVDPDGNVKIGDEVSDFLQVTGSVDFGGDVKSKTSITAPITQDLGSGASSTLSISSSLMFLDADSITTAFNAMMGMDVHTLNLPNGTTSGQRLTLVIEGTMGSANNVPIVISGNILGASDIFMPGSKTSLNFVYYSTSAISAWYQV